MCYAVCTNEPMVRSVNERVAQTTVTYLDNPICLDMISHWEQLSPMATLRGGYVCSTVWKHI